MAETYRRWRLPELWEMVAADDAANTHLHLATLRRQQTALETQRDRLRTLRDQLTEAWPPEKSEAATAFVQRVNDMIVAISLTANGAADVRTNLSLIVDAINQARTELATLVDKYPDATNLPNPRVGHHTRKSLDEQARRVLMAADAAIAEPAAALNIPLPVYQRISLQEETPASPPVTTNGSSSGASPGGGFGRSAAGGFAPPRFDPPESTADLTRDEVLLAGGRVDDAGRGPIPSFPGVADATRSVGGAMSGTLLGPGRVLGADRLSHPGAPSAPATSGGVLQRGVIGGVAGGVPAGHRPLGAAGVHGPAAGTAAGSASRGAGARDRDASWTVPQGVAPVIEPPAVRPHDPGPGVLGIDR